MQKLEYKSLSKYCSFMVTVIIADTIKARNISDCGWDLHYLQNLRSTTKEPRAQFETHNISHYLRKLLQMYSFRALVKESVTSKPNYM